MNLKNLSNTPTFAIIEPSGVHMYYKSKKQLLLLTRQHLAKHFPNSYVSTKDILHFPDITTLSLGLTAHNAKTNLKKIACRATNDSIHNACIQLLNTDSCLYEPSTWAKTFLIALLSRVVTFLPPPTLAPTIWLTNVTQIPDTLQLLLDIVNGPDQWSRKNWKVHQPWILTSKRELGYWDISHNLADYSGGFISFHGKKLYFPLPYTNHSVLLAQDLPADILKSVIAMSPHIIPFYCTQPQNKKSVNIIKLPGEDFYQYKPDNLEKIRDYSLLAAALIDDYLDWFRSKKKHYKDWKHLISHYSPKVYNAGCKELHSSENDTLAAALALFQTFLEFLSIHLDLISTDETPEIMLRWWRLVLPAYAPAPQKAEEAPVLPSDHPETLWSFLASYLETYSEQIRVTGQSRDSGTMALLHRLSEQNYLILPREKFFEHYRRHLGVQTGSEGSSTRADTSLQRSLMSNGLHLKSEGEDTTWRFRFYDAGGRTEKIPCLGFLLNSLPEASQKMLQNLVGLPSEETVQPDTVTKIPEGEIERNCP